MLQLKNIKKSFGGVQALKGVDLYVEHGEIHALLGENGAGKSTLMKVISGAHVADGGEIFFNQKKIEKNSPHIAQEQGISIIYQEFSLVPDLSVSENLFLNRFAHSSWINWDHIYEEAEALIKSLGFDINVKAAVRTLTVAQQQIVEIAKALSQNVKLLILDEPSAVLGPQEIKKLFDMLKVLKAKGVSIIYISHHLEELLDLTDRITILKDGKTIETVDTKAVDKDQLVTLMIGREVSQMYPSKTKAIKMESTIDIKSLHTKFSKVPLCFNVYKGEILGIGGLVGSGRTEVLESLFGAAHNQSNEIGYDDKIWNFKNPGQAIGQGWGMLPEDRKRSGGVLDLSIKQNISLANLGKIANRWGFINQEREHSLVAQLIEQLKIKVGDANNPLSSLSGGNQQKVILGKWLNLDLNVLLIDEPTRGVDVGARSEIYHIIQRLADDGVYVLMVSSDMEELMGLSDRIMVFKNGALQGEVSRPDFSEEAILRLAIGAR
jgi:ribose transport system ATP-binding protein